MEIEIAHSCNHLEKTIEFISENNCAVYNIQYKVLKSSSKYIESM